MASTRLRKTRRQNLMTFYPSSELLLDPSPPRVADTLPGQLARSAARGAAAARRSDPRPFAGRPRAGGGGFVMSLALEAWNLFLQGSEPAPVTAIQPAPLPLGTLYRIEGSAMVLDNLVPPGTQSPTPILIENVTAPIGEISIRVGGAGQAVYVTALVGQPGEVELQASTGVGVGGRFRYLYIISVFVTPMGGGDPIPGVFPTPTPLLDGDYPENVPIPLSLPQLPGVIPITVLVPTVIPRPSDLGRRPVPLLYPPGLTPAQREALPPIWFLPDGIQVGRGYADDRVTSTTGDSINVDIDLDLLTDYQIRNPPNDVVCTADPEPPSDCCDCTEIRQIVIEELDSKFPPIRPNSLQTLSFAAADSGSVDLPEFAQWVRLEIVEPPRNVKEQEGNTEAANVFYNGWYSFGVNTFQGKREPLNYNNVSLGVPKNARKFSYTIIGLGTAAVTVGYLLEG